MGPNDPVLTLKRKMEEILQCVVCLEVPAGHVSSVDIGYCENRHVTKTDIVTILPVPNSISLYSNYHLAKIIRYCDYFAQVLT